MENLEKHAPAADQATGSTFEKGQVDYNPTAQKITTNPRLTIITSSKPKRLTKHYTLQAGKLNKAGGGNMATGHAQTVEVEGLRGLAELLAGLQPNQALCYGTPERESVDVEIGRASCRERG